MASICSSLARYIPTVIGSFFPTLYGRELPTPTKYIHFSDTLTKYSLQITEHAFEISKIMQSFAAGWFNKHALDTAPSEASVTDFLNISFGKVREELRLEAMSHE